MRSFPHATGLGFVERSQKPTGFGRRVFLLSAGIDTYRITRLGGILALAFTGGCSFADAESTSRLPNIALIVVDDMLYNTPESFGGSVEGLTPHIDALVRRGMSFTQAYNASSRCAPSRGSMMTGLFQDGYAVTQQSSDTTVKDEVYTIPELLAPKGYVSGLFGKDTHYRPLAKYGFDTVATMASMGVGRSPELYAQNVGAFIADAVARDRPFFISVNTHDPHRPFAGQPDEDENLERRFGSEVRHLSSPPEYIRPPHEDRYSGQGIAAPGFVPDHDLVREEYGYYLNSSKRADDFVGAIMQTLEDHGVLENTLVVFLSDNGIHWPFAKSNVYVASVKTPLVVYWEGRSTPSSRSDNLISTIDLLPTFLDAAAIVAPYDLPGQSMLPLLEGRQPTPARQHVFATLNKKGDSPLDMRSVITKEHTYVYNFWADGTNLHYDGREWGGLAFQGMKAAAETDEFARQRLEFFFKRTREELYDNVGDADALINLRQNPAHAATLQEYRDLMRETLVENDDPYLADFERFLETGR